jgi:hypothetical protein
VKEIGALVLPYTITSAPKLNLFNRFQTMTTSISNSQPTTTSATIYALLRRRCGGREEDHRAEGADSGEERRGVTMPLKCRLVSPFPAACVL